MSSPGPEERTSALPPVETVLRPNRGRCSHHPTQSPTTITDYSGFRRIAPVWLAYRCIVVTLPMHHPHRMYPKKTGRGDRIRTCEACAPRPKRGPIPDFGHTPMVRPAGFEPATNGLEVHSSDPLKYGRIYQRILCYRQECT